MAPVKKFDLLQVLHFNILQLINERVGLSNIHLSLFPSFAHPQCAHRSIVFVFNIEEFFLKIPLLAREMSFPMRSLAEAATQTLATVILFLKSHSPVSVFSPSLFDIASFFIFSLTLFVIGGSQFISFPAAQYYGNGSQKPNTFSSFFFKLIISWMMKRRLMQGQRSQSFHWSLHPHTSVMGNCN